MSRARKTGEGETVQAVTRALTLMEILARAKTPITSSEMSKQANLKLTTVHRLLYTMMHQGFVEQDLTTLRYRLGLKAFEIGNAALATIDLRATARPFLLTLAEQVNETTNLAVLDGAEVVYIDQLESTNMVIVKMFARIGSRGPGYCTGTGKVLLADLPESDLRQRLAQIEFTKFTEHTITDPEELLQTLKKVQRDGYALDFSERDEGVTCVAAPIRNMDSRVMAALSVSGPVHRMPMEKIVNEILPSVLQAATAISVRLGYQTGSVG